jgi:hypothetical protein
LPQLIEGRSYRGDGCFRIRQQRASTTKSVHEKRMKRSGITARTAEPIDLRRGIAVDPDEETFERHELFYSRFGWQSPRDTYLMHAPAHAARLF